MCPISSTIDMRRHTTLTTKSTGPFIQKDRPVDFVVCAHGYGSKTGLVFSIVDAQFPMRARTTKSTGRRCSWCSFSSAMNKAADFALWIGCVRVLCHGHIWIDFNRTHLRKLR